MISDAPVVEAELSSETSPSLVAAVEHKPTFVVELSDEEAPT